MRKLWGNLKAGLVPAWATWVLFALAVAVYGLVVLMEAHSDRFPKYGWSGLWIFVLALGNFLLGRHGLEETAAKPLSFLLPGYRESLRRPGFSRAVRWGVAFSLYVFSESWQRLLFAWELRQIWADSPSGVPADVTLPVAPSTLEIFLGVAGGLLGGMALCLLWTNGSLVHFRRKWLAAPFVGFGYGIIAVLVLSPVGRRGFVLWPMLILLSVFYCVYFWKCLGDPDWVKSGQREMIVAAIQGPREITVQVNSQRYVAQMRSRRWIEHLFLARIRKADVRSVARSVWAWLYCTFGPTLPYWRWIAILLLAGILIQGYLNRLFVELMMLVIGLLLAIDVLPARSSMLLPEGRKRKYDLTMVAAVFTTLLLTTPSVAAVALSWVLAAVMPPITWGTHQWQYASIPMGSLLLVCLPVPWVFLAGPIWHRVPILRAMLAVVVISLAIGELSSRAYGFYHGPTLLPILLACGWVLLPLALWITYRCWDLVGQQPAKSD